MDSYSLFLTELFCITAAENIDGDDDTCQELSDVRVCLSVACYTSVLLAYRAHNMCVNISYE